jgi:hypothetical protein
MQPCPPGRRSFVGDTLASAQSDAKGAAGIDVTLRAASRQSVADRPLEYNDLVTELNDPELEDPGEPAPAIQRVFFDRKKKAAWALRQTAFSCDCRPGTAPVPPHLCLMLMQLG